MLGWVIACRDECAQVLLDKLENAFGPLARCRAINFRRGMSSNMLSRMMCDALHDTDAGEGVIFLTDKSGEAPYRTASLMSHKHSHCEVISGISYELLAIWPTPPIGTRCRRYCSAATPSSPWTLITSAVCGTSSRKIRRSCCCTTFMPAERDFCYNQRILFCRLR